MNEAYFGLLRLVRPETTDDQVRTLASAMDKQFGKFGVANEKSGLLHVTEHRDRLATEPDRFKDKYRQVPENIELGLPEGFNVSPLKQPESLAMASTAMSETAKSLGSRPMRRPRPGFGTSDPGVPPTGVRPPQEAVAPQPASEQLPLASELPRKPSDQLSKGPARSNGGIGRIYSENGKKTYELKDRSQPADFIDPETIPNGDPYMPDLSPMGLAITGADAANAMAAIDDGEQPVSPFERLRALKDTWVSERRPRSQMKSDNPQLVLDFSATEVMATGRSSERSAPPLEVETDYAKALEATAKEKTPARVSKSKVDPTALRYKRPDGAFNGFYGDREFARKGRPKAAVAEEILKAGSLGKMVNFGSLEIDQMCDDHVITGGMVLNVFEKTGRVDNLTTVDVELTITFGEGEDANKVHKIIFSNWQGEEESTPPFDWIECVNGVFRGRTFDQEPDPFTLLEIYEDEPIDGSKLAPVILHTPKKEPEKKLRPIFSSSVRTDEKPEIGGMRM
jgi:hypothetical protein